MSEYKVNIQILDYNINEEEQKIYIRYRATFGNYLTMLYKEKVCNVDTSITSIIDYLQFTKASMNELYKEALPAIKANESKKDYLLCVNCDDQLENFNVVSE
jgi:hypothetical protein